MYSSAFNHFSIQLLHSSLMLCVTINYCLCSSENIKKFFIKNTGATYLEMLIVSVLFKALFYEFCRHIQILEPMKKAQCAQTSHHSFNKAQIEAMSARLWPARNIRQELTGTHSQQTNLRTFLCFSFPEHNAHSV